MAASDELPSDYDAIILGTGMTECILAAALSRVGHKVLHLDRNDYYSGAWASFSLQSLQSWVKAERGEVDNSIVIKSDVDPATLLKEGERLLPLKVNSQAFGHVEESIHIKNEAAVSDCSPPVPESSTAPSSLDASPPGTEAVCPDAVPHASGDCAAAIPEGDETSEAEPESESSDSAETASRDHGTAAAEGDSVRDPRVHVEEGHMAESIELKVKEWNFTEIQEQWRKFSIDLAPKILFCRGSMVELLISSDIAKYCEFRTITRVLTFINGTIQQVPCSRADVFSSKQVSMIEKRMLMKVLTSCVEYDSHPEDYQGLEDNPFADFLETKKLTPTVHHYVTHAIAMATEQTTTLQGLKSTQKFIKSLGRYGNTAFLWPLYGSGELPQCFCRMCAVFGGVYCLRRCGQAVVLDAENKCAAVIDTEGQRLSAKWLVLEASYASEQLLPEELHQKPQISRAVLLTDRSLLPDKQEHITLLNLQPVGDMRTCVSVLELSHQSMACPKGLYVIHLTCTGSSAREDLGPCLALLFQALNNDDPFDVDSRPKVLWSLFFNIHDTTGIDLNVKCPDNVHIVSGPNTDLDFDYAINEAQSLFEKLCPGEEFIPRAPNPEDIIYDDGQTASAEQDAESGDDAGGEEDCEDADDEEEEAEEEEEEEEEPGENDDEEEPSGNGDGRTEPAAALSKA